MKPNPTTSAQTLRSAPAARRRGAWRKYIPHTIAAALVVAIGVALLPSPIEVEVAQVTTGPLTVSVLEEGRTRIRHRYMVSPPVSGFLRRVELRAGAPIKAGETVLAVIEAESSSFLNPRALAEAEARAKAAEAARDGSEAALERARAAFAQAKKDWERADALRRTGAVSAQDWDAAEAHATMLGREQRTAEFALQTAGHELAQARATLLQAQRPPQDEARTLTILAPVTGFILNVMEESAKVVAAGMPIMEVGDVADLEAEIELLSTDAVGVRPGAEVSIEQWGGPRPLRGKVSVVEPGGYTKFSALGVEEQRVKVRVDFVDPLPPGTFLGDRYRVEARIVTWHADSVLQVPVGALFRRGGDWMTFLADGGRARLAKVGTAHMNGVQAEVTAGLREGQSVVLHPPDVLADGVSIKARR
ncbi:MAG: HlyD family efflux transporter periplasmic adaptor subunit [Chthoniobacteraceae bacterium]